MSLGLSSSGSWFAPAFVEALGWSLVHFLWQGTVVALLLAVALVALRRASPGVRYLAACSGLLLMGVCPVGTLAWSWSVATQQAVAEPPARVSPPADQAGATRQVVARSEPVSVKAEPAPAALASPRQIPVVPRISAPPTVAIRPFLPWLVVAWLTGVIALSSRLCVGWIWIQRMQRRQVRPVGPEWEARLKGLAGRLRVSRPVRLLESALVEVPSVIGCLRPVILIPSSSLVGLASRQLEAILAHELAHVRRHDYLVNLFETALETMLFYHPAVWWVSRTIRAEREASCDEIAAAVSGGRLEYARALASMEELRGRLPELMVAASGGALIDRIRRLVDLPEPRANRSAWWLMATVAVGVLAMVAMSGPGDIQARPPSPAPVEKTSVQGDDWGPESGGLRCRLVAVPATSDAEAPDLSKTTDSFARGDDPTFAVELKNVGEKPVTLLGVRYGDSYPTAAGKLATEFFAPHLFDFEFTDGAGKPVPRPSRAYLDGMLELSGASAHEVAPGKSLVVLLRPAKFNAPMEINLSPGVYKARVRYHGPSEGARAEMKKHWPDKPQGQAWSGEVVSNPVGFTVANDPSAPKPPALQWGEPKNGLRASVEFRDLRRVRPTTDPIGTIPLNSTLDVVFHLENVGDKPISLVSETWRQEDQVVAKDEAGEVQTLGGAWYSGWPIMVRWTLRPGESAELHAATFGVASDDEAVKKFEHPVGKSLVAKPGRYSFRYTIRLGSIQQRDAKGNVTVPGEGDWQGEIVTGETSLVFRARTPSDDAAERAGNFVGRIEFVTKDGKPIDSGSFTARSSGKREDLAATQIHAGPIEIPDCSSRPLTVQVRAPGYEEALFYEVQLEPGEARRLELTPASATRFRLVSLEGGKPIAGAKVRFFNKTSDKASAGPYPMDGLKGPVWATSLADGTVVLDTLQKVDPYYAKLGDAVYFFVIEAPGLPVRFLGPVKAGTDLGEIKLGGPVEVVGEIQGTPEELERFAAEWDQPFEMKTANPEAAFSYAVSEPLETRLEGDKLTFHLKGLRPGKLRIVGNAGPTPHSISHTYGRREPKGTDFVVEVDLEKPITDLVITPADRKPARGDGK